MRLFAMAFLATLALSVPAMAIKYEPRKYEPSPVAPAKEGVVVTDRFVITTPITGCNRDMRRWCRNVTPGANRPLMCLLAHEDKLTEVCELSILEAALANEAASGVLGNAYGACQAERAMLCGDVQAGEGRLASCLRTNETKIGPGCATELKRTGLWDLLHVNVVQ